MTACRRFLWVVATLAFTACSSMQLDMPGRLSPLPRPAAAPGIEAGLARVDITPPPGVGLAGNGPEGRAARGYRVRLYARVLVLADGGGNRLAIVVADLPLGSAVLHRRVAALTAECDSIGVDRLVIAVTHTHAGPGHYFDAGAYNDQASSVVGYDPLLLDSLVARIARAVHAAVADLRPARVAWGSRMVWGYTRIRSLPALLHDIPAPEPSRDAPSLLLPEYRVVDPELVMLRVDQLDDVTGVYRPAGAFSMFAMHATGNAPANDLLDADIPGIVERRLERHIDRDLNHRGDTAFVPRAVHLFANGAEGDVSPAWPPQSRCAVPALAVLPALDGPFTRSLWQWRPPTAEHVAACQHAAREALVRLGEGLGDSASKLFDTLGGALSARMELARAFVTLSLRDSARALGLCPTPAVGMAAFAGAADSHSRMQGWRLFGTFPIGFDEGAANPDAPGCHAQKRELLDGLFGEWLNKVVVAPTLPAFAQVSVLQLGDRLIGTVPGEVTTTAGRRMRDEMLAAARARDSSVRAAHILGLANGYLEYITTPEEYTAQYYEGGSTLYGPGEAAMFGRVLAGLAAGVSRGDTLAPAAARRIVGELGHKRDIVPRNRATRAPHDTIETWCSGDTVYARFELGAVRDWPVSSGDVAARAWVEVVADDAARTIVGRDDDPQLELRLRTRHGGVAGWELRWSGARRGSFRIRIPGRPESRAVGC